LLWPGNEIAQWDWGTIKEHMNVELKSRSSEGAQALPRLVLPGGAHTSFTVDEESNPWPMRKEREEKIGFAMANIEEQRWRAQEASNSSPAMPEQK
jgi:hypothetical protein